MNAMTPPEAPQVVAAPQFSELRNDAPAASGTSLSTFLMRLVGVCVLPLVLLATWLVFNSVLSTQNTRDWEAAGRAQDFATAIDNHLNARIGALQMLAASPLVDDSSRWRDLYREALGFRDSFGSHVILAGVGEPMRMLFNTRVPFGAELPLLPSPRGHAAAPTAAQTGKPAVGDTFPGPIAKQTLVAIAVPAVREGKTRLLLLTIFETGQFQQRIEQVALPPDWSLSLIDGRGDVIARRGPAGFDPARDGDTPGRFVVKSTVSPWSIILEIPRDAYQASIRAATSALVAALLVATLLAVLGGLLAGRRLSRSLATLTQPAAPSAALPDIAEVAQARWLLDETTRRRDTALASQQVSEERLRATFDLAAVGIAHVAPDGRWLNVNQKLCDIVGYTRDELLARSFQDITHPDDLACDLDDVHRLLADEIQTYSMEKRYLHKDGGFVWIDLAVALVRRDGGEPDYFISVVEDISKRKRLEARNRLQLEELTRSEAEGKRLLALAESARCSQLNVLEDQKLAVDALRKSEMSYRTLVENAADAIFVVNPDGRFCQVNSRACEMFGYSAEEFIGMPASAIVAPADLAGQRETFRRVATGERVSVDRSYRRKDGTVFAVEINACQTIGGLVLGIVRDVTERKQTEQALRESEQRFRLAASTGNVWDWNFLTKQVSFPSEDWRILGQRDLDLRITPALLESAMHPDDRPRWRQAIKAHIRCRVPYDLDFRVRTESGEYRWFNSKGQALWDESGRATYMAGTTFDITERKQAEDDVRQLHQELQRHAADLEQRVIDRTSELEAAKIRAEAADRVKSVFLATMSHELRTPLNSIIGFTGVLLQKLPGALNTEQEKQLGIVRNASRHLLALINDVLDISKVEAGELSFARERFDLHALLARLGTAFAPQAGQRGLRFTLDIGQSEAIITGDERRVEQVLNNLLSNALKFTPRGHITLGCTRQGDAYVITVTDTGVGIKPEDMDKLFQPFIQIETGLPGVREGTGLGLAISKHLAQGMGGHIVAQSEWGQGSRFTFTLPTGDKA